MSIFTLFYLKKKKVYINKSLYIFSVLLKIFLVLLIYIFNICLFYFNIVYGLIKVIYNFFYLYIVSSDKNILVAFITAMEKISQKIENELLILKKKINYSDITPGLKDCHIRFLNKVLKPIFEKKEIIEFQDIEHYVKIHSLKYKIPTIRCYLSELHKGKKIEIISGVKDRRKKLYKLLN